jgi:hypothetical protein
MRHKKSNLTFRAAIALAVGLASGAILPPLQARAQDAATADTAKAADAKTPEPPKPHWESVAAAELTLTRGNSDNFLAAASINTTRKWAHEEILLGASGGYGENTTRPATGPSVTSETVNFVKGYAQYNHLFTERFYGGLRVDGLHDEIADITYRFTLSPLVGYYFIKHTNTFLSAEVGPSFVTEKQGGKSDSYVGARLAQRFEHKFKTGAKLWEFVEWIPQVDYFDNWILNAEVGVSAPITKSLDARLVAQDSYDNRPAAGRLKNDFKLMMGIGYRF